MGEEEGRSKMSPTRTLPFLSVSPEAVKSCSATLFKVVQCKIRAVRYSPVCLTWGSEKQHCSIVQTTAVQELGSLILSFLSSLRQWKAALQRCNFPHTSVNYDYQCNIRSDISQLQNSDLDIFTCLACLTVPWRAVLSTLKSNFVASNCL